jgi:Cu(I)/Ag(I) efflux system membrane protein CusA/SilA
MVPVMDGRTQIPIGQLAEVRLVSGPAMLRNENGMLTGYVYVDVAGRDALGARAAERCPHSGQA